MSGAPATVAAVAHRAGLEAGDLRPLLEPARPVLSVHLPIDGTVEGADHRDVLAWRALRDRLEGDGTPDGVLDAVDALVPDAHLHGTALVVVADETGVLHAEHLDHDLGAAHGRWGAVPDVLPLLEHRQQTPGHVVVLVDRGGAEVLAAPAGGGARVRTVGDGDPERKVSPGGWSQGRYQRRAEDDWRATAEEVAAEVARAAGEVDARIVVIGGDERAAGAIVEHLPGAVADLARLMPHGRATDGSDDERETDVRRLVATAVAEDTVDLLRTFEQEAGRHELAVTGAEAVIDALNRSAVEVLLVADGGTDRTVLVGADPTPLDAGDGARAPLVPAAVRAAVGTGARLRVVPRHGPLTDGIGALLRFPLTG